LERQDKTREILGESILFPDLMDRYLKEVSPGKKSWKSDQTNSRCPKEYFKNRRLDTIEPQDIYRYFEWRKKQISKTKKKPVSGTTINREKSLISDAFSKAIKWGYIKSNPVKDVEGFKEIRREPYITDKEFATIKEVARFTSRAEHLPDIMDTLYYTVQRSGKIFSLKWSQINLDERRITLSGGTGNKGVPDELWINQPLFEILSRLRAQRHLQKIVGPYVFQKKDGTPYGSVKTTWNKCCRKAGVKDAHIHDIRHKSITDMGKKGYSLQEIAKAAGHSQISTTLRYTHLRAEDTKAALESLGKC